MILGISSLYYTMTDINIQDLEETPLIISYENRKKYTIKDCSNNHYYIMKDFIYNITMGTFINIPRDYIDKYLKKIPLDLYYEILSAKADDIDAIECKAYLIQCRNISPVYELFKYAYNDIINNNISLSSIIERSYYVDCVIAAYIVYSKCKYSCRNLYNLIEHTIVGKGNSIILLDRVAYNSKNIEGTIIASSYSTTALDKYLNIFYSTISKSVNNYIIYKESTKLLKYSCIISKYTSSCINLCLNKRMIIEKSIDVTNTTTYGYNIIKRCIDADIVYPKKIDIKGKKMVTTIQTTEAPYFKYRSYVPYIKKIQYDDICIIKPNYIINFTDLKLFGIFQFIEFYINFFCVKDIYSKACFRVINKDVYSFILLK